MTKRYLLDARQSRFTVQAFASGMLAGFAHSPKFAIKQFDGEMRFSPEDPGESSLSLTVKASTLDLLDSVKEKDRLEMQKTMLDEVLEVAKYPEISFRSTEVALTKIAEGWYRAQIRGDMRLHGVTNAVSIDSQLRVADRVLRLTGDWSLLLPDYKIKRVTAAAGLIKLKDDLKFQFDLAGHELDDEE
jgi:polyisoprenoid-binding protein YceI